MAEKKNGIVGGLFWSFAERFGSQAVGLLISTILARLIMPEEYGIIAAANVFTSIASVFAAGGIASALIHKNDADDKDYSTMFIFNIGFSLFIYAVIYILAPYLVRIFNSSFDIEKLTLVLRILGIGVVISTINSFYRAILTKKLLFKKLFKLTLLGNILSAAVGIYLAYKGAGVWAIVTQNILSYSINGILFAVSSKWVPKLYFSFTRFKPMYSYGVRLMFANLATSLSGEVTSVAVGNRYTSEELAYYKKGINYPKLLAQNITTAIGTVLFPALANINGNEERGRVVRKFNRICAFILTPIMFGFAAVAPNFVKALLTDKWLSCVPFLQLCCLNYAIQSLGTANVQYLKAAGKANDFLITDIVRKGAIVVFVFVAIWIDKGVIGIALSEVVASVFSFIVTMLPGKKYINYSIKDQIMDVLPMFVLSTVMFLCVYALGTLPMNPFIGLVVQMACGAAIYFLGAKLFHMKEFDESLSMLKKNILKK